MSAADIIEAALRDGLSLSIKEEGVLHYSGDEDSVARWLPVIRENKTEILQAIQRLDLLTAESVTASADGSSCWWRFYYADGTIKEAVFSPPATRSQALRREPQATEAAPFEPAYLNLDIPLDEEMKAVILWWLGKIGEADKTAVLEQCRTDEQARNHYLILASAQLVGD